ncbi:glycosyltransferase family 2 protein [Nocardioides sp. cx-173]|uniref:glycosyltransferase family 2 protein n=1 Tax=Nocardioides sp. cx-173 TaxID=2898796 RepID=UPI001E3432A9|nr:glycosyltransferase family 2 protein [Nocardioides sp. cx-173]MCD4526935.1 glycosyltransferase family 2 protein [Nocardioides sp. cx-173]UGB41277.1 glycosyltransferase family 2 protein [Nocardioides sp. cx-173]
MINIVIPMAGRGSRFADAGYELPKPLIPVRGQVPMVRVVIENLRPSEVEVRYIFLCLRQHLDTFGLADKLREWSKAECVIVPVDSVTEGAACTVLLAKDFIDNDSPLMIANSDQYVNASIDDYLAEFDSQSLDALIMTMTADDPKWSFVRFGDNGEITEVLEKVVVSDEATVGIYNFKRGSDFVRGAEAMIEKELRVNGEFYVAPVYNELISEGAKVGFFNVGSEADGMYGLGIPSDLRLFEELPVSVAAVDDCLGA